jgi:hypothetical protein
MVSIKNGRLFALPRVTHKTVTLFLLGEMGWVWKNLLRKTLGEVFGFN